MSSNITIDDEQFDFVRELLHALTGIFLEDGKKSLVENRLIKHLRNSSYKDFNDYLIALQSGNEQELEFIVNILTTNVTNFFREPNSLKFLSDIAIPAIKKNKKPSEIINLWSAGCASGEEPYSIAMTLANMKKRNNFQIVASDISTEALNVAQEGVYEKNKITEIPMDILKKYFLCGKGDFSECIKVIPEIQERIEFKYINMKYQYDYVNHFDVVFLCNMLMYFKEETKKDMLTRVYKCLKKPGYLIMGRSESAFVVPGLYRQVGEAIFVKE